MEGALRMHGCVDVIGLLLVHAALAATPEGGEMIALQRLYQTRARRGDNYSACLPPLHKKLIHGVPSPRHEFERLGERDLPATTLGNVYDADTGALRRAAGF